MEDVSRRTWIFRSDLGGARCRPAFVDAQSTTTETKVERLKTSE
jgi:hypothetical protein